MAKIIQAWQQTPDGQDTSFSQSYGASTDQARAVANGLKADLVFLSTGDDVNLLVDAGLVDSKWNRQAYDGIAADTLVVFAVRNGNPKHNGSTREAQVLRVVHLGFEVRAELVRDDGEPLAVQLTRDQAAELELERGQIVYVRPTRETVFAGPARTNTVFRASQRDSRI